INAQMKAQGSAFGESVEFTYHADGNYLTYSESGQTYYIEAMQADGVTELIVSMEDIAGGYAVCVSPDSLDGYEGNYTAAGTGNYITLDGLGNAKFVNGTAELYENGKLVATYAYSVGDFGLEFTSGSRRYLFIECPSTESGAYVKDGEYRRLAECDALYGYSAYLAVLNEDGNLEVNNNVSFLFNGIGTLTCSDGTVYSYKIDSRDRANMEYVLTLETSSGSKLRAVLDYSGTVTLEIGECDKAPLNAFTDKDGTVYRFDGLSNLSVGGTFYVADASTTTLLIYRISGNSIKIYNINNTEYGEFVHDGGYKIILANANKDEILLTAAE
ncbi:MAG: hypothetical protein K2K28_04700, partial [Clostridia bacterium]|nr:hypothetical protein [Clostridia bacterium]